MSDQEVVDRLTQEVARLQGIIEDRQRQDLQYLNALVAALRDDVEAWKSEAHRLDKLSRELDSAHKEKIAILQAQLAAAQGLNYARGRGNPVGAGGTANTNAAGRVAAASPTQAAS